MTNERFKARIDKLWWIIFAITNSLVLLCMILLAVFDLRTLPLFSVLLLILNYLIVSPLFGYAELREEMLYIKFGLILKKEIPYSKIRGTKRQRAFYSDSMLALKNAFTHINIMYNTFDLVSVSVKDEEKFVLLLEEKLKTSK